MKKRFVVPLVTVAIPVQLAALGAVSIATSNMLGINDSPATKQKVVATSAAKQETAEAPAAKSDYDSCLELRVQVNTLQAGLGDKSYDCDRVKNWVAPKDRLAAAGGRTQLILNCEATFKPLLNDPASYRYQGADVVANANNGMDVTVRYTATNSFGGRVQQDHTCYT